MELVSTVVPIHWRGFLSICFVVKPLSRGRLREDHYAHFLCQARHWVKQLRRVFGWTAWQRSRSCEPCRSAIVPQDWHKQSPSWAASTRRFMRSTTSTRKAGRAAPGRYREGQEDQLGALGLVVNVIVLWNTIYIKAALQQLEQEGFEIQSEDITRLSLLPK
jgi:hypothetical protein